ncbi:sugar transferase [Tunturiibacter gelidiferens]|uniref:sugar transferase n=1 Tax=Tunturiibacter gelidiferens TaxID=3069689 RepID=UPI003D9AD4B0
MATTKPARLPRIKKVSAEDDSSASYEGRLQIAPIQEAIFVQMLRLERRRSERSGKQFMLVLISGDDFQTDLGGLLIQNVVAAISSNTRETDVLGWYEQDVTLGLLMTEIGQADAATVDTIIQKISVAVQRAVNSVAYHRLTLVFRVFPQEIAKLSNGDELVTLYPDISSKRGSKRRGRLLKRGMDIFGSLFALIVFFPAFLVIALLVKLTSKGPVLFAQKRVGQFGREFTFFKFRTMHADNDPQIHREYVTKLIAGGGDLGQGNGVYKLVNDPRVTPLGRFLRKSSLDELPQFVNVLMNDMSLVGPRPPLPYEYERYQTWHKRRVLELKPGLTGLWQIEGRSRTTFDEMVRMDIRYANIWSLWLDVKIVMQTPAAMLSGRGAC